MVYLSSLLVGVFFILFELSNRKLKIDKSGISFDRLCEKKPFLIKWREYKEKSKHPDKIKIEDL